MRRTILLGSLLGSLVCGVGCKVITGQQDCTYDPAATTLPPTAGHPPYAVVGSPVTGVGVPAAATPTVGEHAAPKTDKAGDVGR